MQPVLFHLVLQCGLWSLMAIGGNTVALGDIHRYTVAEMRWLNDAQFVSFFALSQALPGPNGMFLVFIGQHVAGVPGALATLIAKLLSCSALTWFGAGWLEHHADTPWVLMTKRALVPVSIGLILAASYILIGSLELNRLSLLLTTVSALVVVFSKLNPLWLIAIGVGLGLLSAQSGAYWFGS